MDIKRDESIFLAGASLRIFGAGLDIDGITRKFGYTPDHKHRAGDLGPGKSPYPHDMWSLASPLGEDRDLEAHLAWLAEKFLRYSEYIRSLRETFYSRYLLLETLFYGTSEPNSVPASPDNLYGTSYPACC
jgi:hypothetical protein